MHDCGLFRINSAHIAVSFDDNLISDAAVGCASQPGHGFACVAFDEEYPDGAPAVIHRAERLRTVCVIA